MKRFILLALLCAPVAGFASVYASSFERPIPMYTEASCIEYPIGLYKGRVHTYLNLEQGGFRVEGGPFGGPLNYVLFKVGLF